MSPFRFWVEGPVWRKGVKKKTYSGFVFRQLILLCDLFDIEDINDYLSPIAMTLAIDKISEIRQVTHRLVSLVCKF